MIPEETVRYNQGSAIERFLGNFQVKILEKFLENSAEISSRKRYCQTRLIHEIG